MMQITEIWGGENNESLMRRHEQTTRSGLKVTVNYSVGYVEKEREKEAYISRFKDHASRSFMLHFVHKVDETN